jgi:hypothetical protein
MLRRRIRIAIVILLLCTGHTFSGALHAQNVDARLTAVPLPTLSAAKAVDIANELKRKQSGSGNFTVVAIDWCKSSEFQPRYSDGSDMSVRGGKDEYAWFVTYLEPAPADIQKLVWWQSGLRRVSVIRIRDNGTADFMLGIRT